MSSLEPAVAADKFSDNSLGKMQRGCIIGTALAGKTCRKSRIQLLSDLCERLTLSWAAQYLYRSPLEASLWTIIEYEETTPISLPTSCY